MDRNLSKWDRDNYWRVERKGAVDLYPRLPGDTIEEFQAELKAELETTGENR